MTVGASPTTGSSLVEAEVNVVVVDVVAEVVVEVVAAEETASTDLSAGQSNDKWPLSPHLEQ